MTARSGNVHIRYAMPEHPGTASTPGSSAFAPADRRVAYAIGKKTGKAVQRNRLRRRLRAIFRETAAGNAELFPPGDYLVRVTAPESSYRQLKEDVTKALNQLKPTVKSH